MLQKEKKKKSPLWSVLSILLIIIAAAPEESGEIVGTLIGIALIFAPFLIPLILWTRRKKHREEHQSTLRDTTYTPCREEQAYSEKAQKLFCRHDDKAIHHVRRGKEIDPWDRPDIDISKYQRRK